METTLSRPHAFGLLLGSFEGRFFYYTACNPCCIVKTYRGKKDDELRENWQLVRRVDGIKPSHKAQQCLYKGD